MAKRDANPTSIQYNHARFLHMVSATIGLMLSASILIYVKKLEHIGCPCALNWRRHYIHYYSKLMIVFAIVELAVSISGDFKGLAAKTMNFLSPLIFVAGVFFAIFGIQYVHYLKDAKCKCSEDFGRDILYIVAVVDAFFFALIGIMSLLAWIRFSITTQ